jgi:hypothetical protein
MASLAIRSCCCRPDARADDVRRGVGAEIDDRGAVSRTEDVIHDQRLAAATRASDSSGLASPSRRDRATPNEASAVTRCRQEVLASVAGPASVKPAEHSAARGQVSDRVGEEAVDVTQSRSNRRAALAAAVRMHEQVAVERTSPGQLDPIGLGCYN